MIVVLFGLIEPGCITTLKVQYGIDSIQRAVLTISALTHLVLLRRNTSLDDISGLESIEFLERLVINGSISERDSVLRMFMETESFDSVLASRRSLEIA